MPLAKAPESINALVGIAKIESIEKSGIRGLFENTMYIYNTMYDSPSF